MMVVLTVLLSFVIANEIIMGRISIKAIIIALGSYSWDYWNDDNYKYILS
jgi:hypothetical protein